MDSVYDVISALYAALSEGDIDWIRDRLLAGDHVHIGPAASLWMSNETFLSELARQFREELIIWTAGPVMVHQHGDVAWAVDQPSVRFDDGSELTERVSLVFVNEEGSWKLAHSHASFGSG